MQDAEAKMAIVANANDTSDLETAILVEMVQLLRRVSPEARERLAEAALTFLNVPRTIKRIEQQYVGRVAENNGPSPNMHVPQSDNSVLDLPRRTQVWLNQYKIRVEDLDNIFHWSATGVELIAHQVEGRTKKDQVQSCYLLMGVRAFLQTGEPKFSDEDARESCRDLGCYDPANHATYVSSLGNMINGSKKSGYELTQPGLRAAGELLRGMTNA